MTMRDCFEVLDITPTSDQRAIKRAYAAKLKTIDPDTNPDAFMALREAYETARMRARYEVYDTDGEDAPASNAEFELDKECETQESLAPEVQTTESLSADQLPVHADNMIVDEAFFNISIDKDAASQADLNHSDGDILDELEALLKSPWCNEDRLYYEETKLNQYFKTIPLERFDDDLDRFASIIAENIPAGDVLMDLYFKHRVSDVCHQHYCFAEAILRNRMWEIELRNHLFRCSSQMYQFYRDLKTPPSNGGAVWPSYETLNRTEYLLLWFEEFCPTVLKELDSKQCQLWRDKIKQAQKNKGQFMLFGKANRNRLWKTGLGGDLPKLDPTEVEPAPGELVRSPILFAFLCILPLVAALFIKAAMVTKKVVEFTPSQSLPPRWAHLQNLNINPNTLDLLDKKPVSPDPSKWLFVIGIGFIAYIFIYLNSIPVQTKLTRMLAVSLFVVIFYLSFYIITL